MKKFNKLYDLAGKLEDELDFDFRAQSQRIDSFQEFYENSDRLRSWRYTFESGTFILLFRMLTVTEFTSEAKG